METVSVFGPATVPSVQFVRGPSVGIGGSRRRRHRSAARLDDPVGSQTAD